MLPTEDLFVYVYVLVDDAITSGNVAIPARPGPAPACSDAELLTIALVRHASAGPAQRGRFLVVEATLGELTNQMELARHAAHTFWGLLTRTTAIIAAHTLLRVCQHCQ